MYNITEYLTQLAADKVHAAQTLTEVADSINIKNKRFTSASFKHEAAMKFNDSYWGAILSVNYVMARKEGGSNNDYSRIYLIDKTSGALTPVEVRDQLLLLADSMLKSADNINAELLTLPAKRAALISLQEKYNTIVDSLTPYARDCMGVQHNYNHLLEDN